MGEGVPMKNNMLFSFPPICYICSYRDAYILLKYADNISE